MLRCFERPECAEPFLPHTQHTICILDAPEHSGQTYKHGVRVLDQLRLPHQTVYEWLYTTDDACRAIADMTVRGAGLIGNTAACGMWLAAREHSHLAPPAFTEAVRTAGQRLIASRPTARNLAWAVERQLAQLTMHPETAACVAAMRAEAEALIASEREAGRLIGEYGKSVIEELASRRTGVLNILTHCNAGWLAFAGYGSALAPIYAAHAAGIAVHVWVDETRPRNQGAQLTAWELGQAGVPHSLLVDNTGGHLMQHGLVDMVIVGADRVTRRGDTANKIGTYLKALAAYDNSVPFYVALPVSTFDTSLNDGIAEIPIEERGSEEVRIMSGITADGRLESVRICPEFTPARNWGFDVTPARLITGLITEHGVCSASDVAISSLLQRANAKL